MYHGVMYHQFASTRHSQSAHKKVLSFSVLILLPGQRELHPACKNKFQLECGTMPNVMVTLPNIGDILCSTP